MLGVGRADEEQGEEMWYSLIGKMEWRFLSLVQGVLLREYIKKRLSFGQCPKGGEGGFNRNPKVGSVLDTTLWDPPPQKCAKLVSHKIRVGGAPPLLKSVQN